MNNKTEELDNVFKGASIEIIVITETKNKSKGTFESKNYSAIVPSVRNSLTFPDFFPDLKFPETKFTHILPSI